MRLRMHDMLTLSPILHISQKMKVKEACFNFFFSSINVLQVVGLDFQFSITRGKR